MTAFRPFDPFQTFTDQHGNLNAGGQLVFFDSGTTTPRDVYADQGLTTNLGNSVQIGTDGRPVSDIWADGNYRVRLLDVNNVQIGPDRDNVQIPGGSGAALPTPFIPDYFLTNDGAVPGWAEINQVPDPTGQSGKVLGSDGTTTIWVNQATPPAAANIDVSITKTLIADTSTPTQSLMILQGTGSVDASGAHTTSGTVNFPTAFNAPPQVYVQPTGNGITPNGFYGIPAVSSVTSSGFTVGFNVNEGGTASGTNITSAPTFQFLAIGTVATPS